ncbi:LOW QUALITY PROTEIN: glycerol-3-phosphate acyltransferase 2, mitochondrial [Amia ocellicauda]|uniref:LOW QUALITY PROTEIN: glycerol-3-phosphate acyltransferase 2, mitochondrial n=1 Tax=Amia ocellicauda TaxID=2972642 RepID=UPI0034649F03
MVLQNGNIAPPTRRNPVTWGLALRRRVKQVAPLLGTFRPSVGRCCPHCTPDSVALKLLQSHPSLGFQNLLCVTEKQTRYRGWLVRRLCCVLLVGGGRVPPSDATLTSQSVLQSHRVQSLLCPQGGASGVATREQAEHIVSSISTCFCLAAPVRVCVPACACVCLLLCGSVWLCVHLTSPPPLSLSVRVLCWVLLKVLGHLLSSVQLNLNQLAALHEASKRGSPLVLVSVHRSSLDYALLPLALFCHNLGVPYSVGPPSLDSTWLRFILQRLGVILTPQCPMGEQGSMTDSLYHAIMPCFVGELLREGNSMLIFLEEACPSSRRPSPRGAQWLAWVRGAVRAGAVSDVAIVPVGVAYDRTGRETGTQVQTGTATTGEVYWRAECGWSLGSVLWGGPRGNVRLHFGEPFSLKEMVESGRRRMEGRPLQDILLPLILHDRSESLFAEQAQPWLLPPTSCPELPQAERHLVISLTTHLLHLASSYTAVTSTAIVSCLLLHKHRKGVCVSMLCADFSWLLEEVLFRGRDVGFGGTVGEVLTHALSLLKGCLVLGSPPSGGPPVIVPRAGPHAALTLSAHCEVLCSVFSLEAVGACAVSAMMREVVSCAGEEDGDVVVALCEDQLTERALQLCHLLPRLLLPPCQSACGFAQDAVDSLVRCGILTMEELPGAGGLCDLRHRRAPLQWRSVDEGEGSDSDCDDPTPPRCYKLSCPRKCPELLFVLCSLLSGQLRALSWSTDALPLLQPPRPEAECVARVHRLLQDRAQAERGHYESSSLQMAASAVHTFTDLGVLTVQCGVDGRQALGLSTAFQDEAPRFRLHSFIAQFLFH